MDKQEPGQETRAEALKRLRETRRQTIKAATDRMKVQKKAIAAIKDELRQGERTVPEIAAATGLQTAEVLWFIASLKKYGEILEGPIDGSFYRYRLAQPTAVETESDLSE